ncbi:hypothetical protein CAEBREN_09025 [Caenorhabditis brenneri]|uniref:F-box domain-containing protein n=1 Tax=Caenorhabditis brenneri TaxID=135651 RepID=G0NCS9_CAEBE|nr:hypothetical protein CAEBREN_09025 [Caenorhabditis brenneri]
MTIPFRYFPYLVQQLVMDHMDFIDVFSLYFASEKSKTLVKSFFNRQECELIYDLDTVKPRILINKRKSLENYHYKTRNQVAIVPKLHAWKHVYLFCSFMTIETEQFQITVESCDDMYKGLMRFVRELFPKIHFSFEFGPSPLEVIRRNMRIAKALNVPIERVKIGGKYWWKETIKEKRMRACLKEYSDVKTLIVNVSPSDFQYDFQTNPPFKFDLFKLSAARWVTKDHLINLFLGCKKVYLRDYRGMSYTELELMEICEKWLEAPETQYLGIQFSQSFSEGIGKLPGAVPLREANADYPCFGHRMKLDPGKGYMMKKADGTPAIVYHDRSNIVFRTDFENAVVDGTF